MQNLPSRFHRLKLVFVSLLMVLGGGSLIALEGTLTDETPWLRSVPFAEFGGIIVGAGLLGVWLDHLFRREQDDADERRLRRVLADHAPLMRDAVLEAFAANSSDLERVATPETLDRIVTTGLGLRLDDERFAAEVYEDIRTQAVEAAERWHDADLTVTLSRPAAAELSDYFEVTVHWEYSAVLQHPRRRFVCLSDRDEYAELAQAQGDTSAWYMKPGGDVTASDRNAYELLSFSVGGEDRKIRRSSRKGFQEYVVDVSTDVDVTGDPVTCSYTYRTLTRRSGHLLFFEIEQPTRDVRMTFNYTDSGIDSVSAVDMFPSVRRTRIEHAPEEVTPRVVRVETDGWVFPRSGVAFVWTLESERPSARLVIKA